MVSSSLAVEHPQVPSPATPAKGSRVEDTRKDPCPSASRVVASFE